MKFSAFFLLLVSFNLSAVAPAPESAKLLLDRLSQSLRQLNFTTSFVVVKSNQAEPYHWLHGIGDDNQELEIFARLNGPRRDILRQGNIVSYIEPEQDPYSIISDSIRGPIPAIFRGNISELESSYRFISVGRSRILGRVAQLVRIVAKDKHRFSYWIWLDQQTGLLLKMAVVTRQGQLLEQIQFTHLAVDEHLPENLAQFQQSELPAVINLNNPQHVKTLSWQVNWLPQGFKIVKSNQHSLNSYNQGTAKAVEFMLFSDGLVDISVYANPSQEKFRELEYASDGATMVFNHIAQNVEISIVGDIPLATASKIAESIGPATSDNSQYNSKQHTKEQ